MTDESLDSEPGGSPTPADSSDAEEGPPIDWDPDDGPFGPVRTRLERVGMVFVGVIVAGILLAIVSGETLISLDTTDFAITYLLLPYATVLGVLWVIDAVSAWRER